MPWRKTEVENERIRLVIRHEQGERMSDLCREFEVSRKTGYKFWNRYKRWGPAALGDHSKRPERHPNRTTDGVAELVYAMRRRYPTWGPKKLHVLLKERHPGIRIPSPSTIGELLKRKGLSKKRRRRRRCSPTTPGTLTEGTAANEVWCADFKGQFKMGNGHYCYTLTITDQYSRLLISCTGLDSTSIKDAQWVFEQAFREYGLPRVMRTCGARRRIRRHEWTAFTAGCPP